MTTTRREERGAGDAGPDDRPDLLARIGRQVLQALGQPVGLRGVDVRPLWGNHFRANVLVGQDVTTTTVTHSYFLVADAAGTILAAAPPITRRYP
jgi:hypothetical protein